MSAPATRPPEPPLRLVPRSEPSRAARGARALLAVVVAPIVLGSLVVLLLAQTPWGNERVRRVLVSQANSRINGHVVIGRLRGNLFANALLSDVQVRDSLNRPVFTAAHVRVRYALLPFLRGRVVLHAVALDSPVVVLDKRPNERWNFQELVRRVATPRDTARHGVPPELGVVSIVDGRVLLRTVWRPDTTLAAARRDAAVTAALLPSARSRTERVTGGYQRVMEFSRINARLPVIHLPRTNAPLMVQVESLSLLAAPYRPPVVDIRAASGTLLATADSLWWHGVRVALPGSRLGGDGRIGLKGNGLDVRLVGAPLDIGDFRAFRPSLPASGGGRLTLAAHVRGDSAQYSVSNADLSFRDAHLTGDVAIDRVRSRMGSAATTIRGADVTVARLSTAIVHELAPSLTLRRTGVLDGHVVVSGPTSAMHVNADVRFDDATAGLSHVLVNGGIGMSHGIQARDLTIRAFPVQLRSLEGNGLRLPVGGTLSGIATVSGATHAPWLVRGDLTHVDGGQRSRVTGSGRYDPAGRRVLADATLSPLSLETVGRFAPMAQLRGAVTGRVHAAGTVHDLRVTGALRSTSGGDVRGEGFVQLRGAQTRYDVSVVADALNARAFSARAPSTRLTGHIVARGVGTKPATADAELSADLRHSRYDTLSLDRLTTRLAVHGGLLRLDTLVAVASGAAAEARGTLGLVPARDGSLSFSIVADSLGAFRHWLSAADTIRVYPSPARQKALLVQARADSARRAETSRIERLAIGLPVGDALVVDTLASIRRDSLGGTLLARGTVRGNIQRPALDAAIHGRNLVARGYSARALDATFTTPDMRAHDRQATFGVGADGVTGSGLAFERIDATGGLRGRTVSAAVSARQDSLVSYAALGQYSHPGSGEHVIHLDSLIARFDTLTWRLAHPAGVRLAKGDMAIDSVDLRSSAGGRLFANGRVPAHEAMHLDVAAENVRVSTVLAALQREAVGDGRVSAQATVGGTRANPVLAGRATLRDANYRATRAPDVDADVRYSGKQLDANALARDSTGRRVLSASAALPLDLALEKVAGSRKMAGPIRADVVMDSLSLATLPLDSRSFEDVHGNIAGDAHLRGAWRSPRYSGRGALRDGGVFVTSTGMRLEQGVADLRLTGDSLLLDSLVARAGGSLRASGSVDLTDRAHPFVRMAVSGASVRVMDATRGLVDADMDISAVGPLDSVRVTGGGEMKHGFLALKQFRKDLLRVKAPGSLTFFAVYDTTTPAADVARAAAGRQRTRRMAVIADLSLVVDRGSYYRNRPDANTEFYTGQGEVVIAHIDQRTSDQWAVGFVRIGQGIAIFRARAFTPARGTLTFLPRTNGPGFVEQVGERLIWESGRGIFPLQLLTGGTSKAPAVGLESGTLFPIRGRELDGYLTLGHDYTSLLQQSGSSLAGSEAWSGQLSGESGALAHRQQAATALGVVLHDIGTGATKAFSLDAFSVSPADLPTELVFGKTGGARGAQVEAGRYVTVDRYVAAQMRLTTAIPGVRVSQLFGSSYRLDVGVEPRFLFGNPPDLGITHPTVRTGVFGAFLTRMWGF